MVYKVEHKETGSIAVMKTIWHDKETMEVGNWSDAHLVTDLYDNLEGEARAIPIHSALRHPRTSFIREMYRNDHADFLVMDCIDGESLEDKIKNSPGLGLSLEAVTYVTTQLVEILFFLHSLGVSHRDIKPANIMVTEGWKVYLIDLDSSTLDHGGYLPKLWATYGYNAPELGKRPKDKDTETAPDIFSLGATIFTMLTSQRIMYGKHPERIPGLVERWLDERGDVPDHVRQVIHSMLSPVEVRPTIREVQASDWLNGLWTYLDPLDFPHPQKFAEEMEVEYFLADDEKIDPKVFWDMARLFDWDSRRLARRLRRMDEDRSDLATYWYRLLLRRSRDNVSPEPELPTTTVSVEVEAPKPKPKPKPTTGIPQPARKVIPKAKPEPLEPRRQVPANAPVKKPLPQNVKPAQAPKPRAAAVKPQPATPKSTLPPRKSIIAPPAPTKPAPKKVVVKPQPPVQAKKPTVAKPPPSVPAPTTKPRPTVAKPQPAVQVKKPIVAKPPSGVQVPKTVTAKPLPSRATIPRPAVQAQRPVLPKTAAPPAPKPTIIKVTSMVKPVKPVNTVKTIKPVKPVKSVNVGNKTFKPVPKTLPSAPKPVQDVAGGSQEKKETSRLPVRTGLPRLAAAKSRIPQGKA